MTYLIKTINGEEYVVTPKERDAMVKILTKPKEERTAFVEIKSQGAIIATASITSITVYKKDYPRCPSQEEQLAEFNERWRRDNPEEGGQEESPPFPRAAVG